MPPTLIADVLTPLWQALTPDQQIAWGFYGNETPLTTQRGAKWALHSFQAFAQVNGRLATVDETYVIEDPPTTTTPPSFPQATLQALPQRARAAWDWTQYPGWAFLILDGPLPATTAAIVRNSWRGKTKATGRTQTGNHITTIKPTEDGPINLQVPRGYYASTGGAAPRATMSGRRALRFPSSASILIEWLSLTNGQVVRQQLSNPHPR